MRQNDKNHPVSGNPDCPLSGRDRYARRLEALAGEYREKTAITHIKDGRETAYSFGDLFERILSWKENLEGYRISPGDRAAVIAPVLASAGPNVIVSLLALAYCNVTAVVIDPNLPAEELDRLVAYADVRCVFTVEEIYGKLSEENTCRIPVFDLDASGRCPVLFPGSREKADMEETADRHCDVMVILFSSGTSASMKAVMLPYDSMLLSMDKQKYVFGLQAGEKHLLILPPSHVSGYACFISFLFAGCSIGIVEGLSLLNLSSALLAFNPHYFGMVPKVYDKIADKIISTIRKKNVLVRSLIFSLIKFCGFCRKRFGIKLGRYLLRGISSKAFGKNITALAVMGSISRTETAELFLNLGLDWANVYGATEMNGPVSSTGVHDRYAHDSVGNVLQFEDIDIRIHNPGEDGVGEIYVRTPLIMKGYFRDPEATAEAFDGGYFRTGDLGYIDGENYLHLTGRAKDSIVLHNGEKASAQDVDHFYQAACPEIAVASCALTGRDGTDRIHLFVERGSRPEAEVSRAVEGLRGKSLESRSIYSLAGIHIIDKIPVTSIGKVKRYLLKEYLEDSRAGDPETETGSAGGGTVEEMPIKIISGCSGFMGGDITLESRLAEDLGLDSLNMLELCVRIEFATGRDVADRLKSSLTVRELADIVSVPPVPEKEKLRTGGYPRQRTGEDIRLVSRLGQAGRLLYRLGCSGIENIPAHENVILCPNHESYLDGMWIAAVLQRHGVDVKRFHCIAAEHLMEHPILKKGFYALGGIPVDRRGNAVLAMKRAQELLQEMSDCLLLVHPEGTRSRNGKLGNFKNGAAKLSQHSGAKIVPVCVSGAYEIFPPSRRLPRLYDWKRRRRYRLHISFGTPIAPDGRSQEEITAMIRAQIMEMKEGPVS